MADFNQTVNSLFDGLNGVLTTKTVVGEPTKIGDTIILPLVDVNFGMGAASNDKEANKKSARGGMGGKMTPSAVLVIQDGKAKMVSVKPQDTISKILDMVPELIDKVAEATGKGSKSKKEDEEAINKAIEELHEESI